MIVTTFMMEPDMELMQAALSADVFGTPAYFWLTFVGIVVALLAFDLGILHKEDKTLGTCENP